MEQCTSVGYKRSSSSVTPNSPAVAVDLYCTSTCVVVVIMLTRTLALGHTPTATLDSASRTVTAFNTGLYTSGLKVVGFTALGTGGTTLTVHLPVAALLSCKTAKEIASYSTTALKG